MTRSELIHALALDYEGLLPQEDLEEVVDLIVEALADSLVQDRGTEIRGFGSFRNRVLAPRTGRNPKSGEPVSLRERLIPAFKAGQDLKAKLIAIGQ